MRKQGLEPGRDDKNWGGAVISRRQHRQTRVQKEDEKEREEAEALPLDLKDIVAKRPENRLKWLQRALILAGKKRVQLAAIYDIVQHKKFVDGISHGVGKQMRTLLLANLHLFSQKQQRALQSESCKFSAFADEARGLGKEPSPDAGADGRRGASADGPRSGRRSRDRSRSGSSSSRRRDRGSAATGAADSEKGARPTREKRQDARAGQEAAATGGAEASRPEGRRRSRSRSRGQEEGEAKQPARLTGLKMKLQPWQPHVLRAAAAAPP